MPTTPRYGETVVQTVAGGPTGITATRRTTWPRAWTLPVTGPDSLGSTSTATSRPRAGRPAGIAGSPTSMASTITTTRSTTTEPPGTTARARPTTRRT